MMKRGIDAQTRLKMEQARERSVEPYAYPSRGIESITHYKRIEGDSFISFTQSNDYANKQKLYVIVKFDGKYPETYVTNNRGAADKKYGEFEKDVFG